uniref:Methyltransferase FkbM domain-containing protein n=1 Tax=Panagrolaimus davidi TaxID=227884 RepID=A0A914P5B9_9BILA
MDVKAEKDLLKMLPQCKFIGVDPDPDKSGKPFIEVTKGKYIEGAVGVSAGFYNSTVLKKNAYKQEVLQHYSLKELLSQNFKDNEIVDFLFMDIEGAEFELIEDLINNPNEYPIICQINVEFHDPNEHKGGKRFFQSMMKSVKEKVYLPIKVDPLMKYSFNRIFFMNINEICLNKFYI